MTESLMTAYHKCTECDNCEEKPAKFLCKTCPGYLCEVCKIEHEKKKISQYHIIAFFTSSNEDTINFLYCSVHEKKILECYCNVCHKPVCTECILQSHNGHSMKLLSIFYKEMREDSLKKKKEIENTIIPHYNQLLTNESEKKVSLSKRTEEIEKEIVHHTNYLVMEVKEISEQMIRNLKTEEKKGLREIDHFIYSIQRKIETIQGINERLSASLEAKPSILFFELIENIDLEDFRTLHFQPAADYTFDNFQPGNITSIQELFGLLPKIKRTGGVYELKSKSNREEIMKKCRSSMQRLRLTIERSRQSRQSRHVDTEARRTSYDQRYTQTHLDYDGQKQSAVGRPSNLYENHDYGMDCGTRRERKGRGTTMTAYLKFFSKSCPDLTEY